MRLFKSVLTHTMLFYNHADLNELKEKTNEPLKYNESTCSLEYHESGVPKARIDLEMWFDMPLYVMERQFLWAMPDIKKTQDYLRLKENNHRTPVANQDLSPQQPFSNW